MEAKRPAVRLGHAEFSVALGPESQEATVSNLHRSDCALQKPARKKRCERDDGEGCKRRYFALHVFALVANCLTTMNSMTEHNLYIIYHNRSC